MKTTPEVRANRFMVNYVVTELTELIKYDGISRIWSLNNISHIENNKSSGVNAFVDTMVKHMNAKWER